MSFGVRDEGHETYVAGEDLTGSQYRCLQLSFGSVVTLAEEDEYPIGVLVTPVAEGRAARVATKGLALLQVMAADTPIIAGMPVMPGADGRGVKAEVESRAVGIAMEDAFIDNQIISIYVDPQDVSVALPAAPTTTTTTTAAPTTTTTAAP